MTGTITSADDGNNVPSDDGFVAGGDFILTINGGTTIDAVLQKFNQGSQSWQPVSDDLDRQNITGAWEYPIDSGNNDRFRIAVTTATGTWGWYVAKLRG